MKFLILTILKFFLVFNSAPSHAKDNDFSGCDPFSFRALAQSNHNPELRSASSLKWLKTNGDKCSFGEIVDIKSNLSNWLGTSLTSEITGLSANIFSKKYFEFEKLKSALKLAKLKDKELIRQKLFKFEFRPVEFLNSKMSTFKNSQSIVNNVMDSEDDDEDEDEDDSN